TETTGTKTGSSGSSGPLKVAATMPSPLDDFGWSQAESKALKNVIDDMDGVELTKIVDSVPYKDTKKVVSDLARKNDVIVADSNGRLQTGTLEASKQIGDTYFMTRNTALPPDDLPENHIVYNQHLAMVWGPMAYVAGLLSETNKIGDVDSIPVLVRAHALRGAKCALAHVNSDAQLDINWINSWYDPGKTRRNAESLLNSGVDVLINGTNGAIPGKVAADHGKLAVGYGIDMSAAAPDGYATSVLMKPEPIFKEGISAALNDNWSEYWNKYDNHHPWAPKDYQGEGTIGLADWHDSVSQDVRTKTEKYVEKVDNYGIKYPEVWKKNVCPDGTKFELDLPNNSN
ncbi:MAG: BMP family ABC transporter substrate-binding protein, partial [Salinigranum sp.]